MNDARSKTAHPASHLMNSSLLENGVFIDFLWPFILGTSGLLDILATILPGLVQHDGETCLLDDDDSDEANHFSPFLLRFTDFLRRNCLKISVVYSILCCIAAFIKATRDIRKVIMEKEHSRLLLGEEQETKWWNNPYFVYFRSIAFIMLVLPVGIYYVVYYVVNRFLYGRGVQDIGEDNVQHAIANIDKQGFVRHNDRLVDTKNSVLLAVFQYYSNTTAQLAKENIKDTKSKIKKKGIGRAIRFARTGIRHPLKFRRQLKQVFTWIRYIQHGLPVFIHFSKTLNNTREMMKRWRQWRNKKKAKKIRQILWDKKPVEVKEKDAAIMLQNAYRAQKARKLKRALQILQADRESMAFSKIQHMLRRKVSEARSHLQKQKDELKRLKEMEKDQLTDSETIQIFEFRYKVAKETKDLVNRKMLIRPNRTIILFWRSLCVVCLLYELSQKAMVPWLKKNMSMAEFVAQKFVPTKVSKLSQCMLLDQSSQAGKLLRLNVQKGGNVAVERPWYCHEPYSASQEAFADLIALALDPKPLSQWPDCLPPKRNKAKDILRNGHEVKGAARQTPWFCASHYFGLHEFYRVITDLFMDQFLDVVSFVCFLDVFVTFFTGEFHADNGILIPKPFFRRWILPGICLQLLVNPRMGPVSAWVFMVVQNTLKHGPMRVYLWILTVVIPLTYFFFVILAKPIWLQFVEFANGYSLKNTSHLDRTKRNDRISVYFIS